MADEINTLEDLAEVAGIEAAPEVEMTPREPVKDALGRSYATGKRKDAVARVWIKPGSGKVTVNGKEQNVYFARPVLQMILAQPFTITGTEGQFDVVATVKGGGLSGQAGAVKHGVSKARPKRVRASSSPSVKFYCDILRRAAPVGAAFFVLLSFGCLIL